MKGISLRIIADVILFSLVFYGPWWLFLFVAFILTFIFSEYYEAIMGGVVTDALYGLPYERLVFHNFLFLTITLGFFVFAYFAKKRLYFYSDL